MALLESPDGTTLPDHLRATADAMDALIRDELRATGVHPMTRYEYAIEADPGKCTASFPTFDNWAAVLAAANMPAFQREGLAQPRVLRRTRDANNWPTKWEPVSTDCTQKGCGRPRSEHEMGVFCP